MDTRKLRWMSYGNCIINLDSVDAFIQEEASILVRFSNSDIVRLKNITMDGIYHYLKYGKPKKRR